MLAGLALINKKNKEAIAWLEKALQYDPDYSHAQVMLAEMLCVVGTTESLRRAFNLYLDLAKKQDMVKLHALAGLRTLISKSVIPNARIESNEQFRIFNEFVQRYHDQTAKIETLTQTLQERDQQIVSLKEHIVHLTYKPGGLGAQVAKIDFNKRTTR